MTYGWAILVAIIVLGVLWFLLDMPQKQEFKIYKEECWNEPCFASVDKLVGVNFTYKATALGMGNEGKCIIEYPKDCSPNNKTIFGEVPEFMCEGQFSESTCERVEVDKLQYNEEQFMNLCNEENKGNFATCEDIWNWAKQLSGYAIVFKEDITLEMLNENCLCLEQLNSEENVMCIATLENNYCQGFEYDGCYKYKCGDYLVEDKTEPK